MLDSVGAPMSKLDCANRHTRGAEGRGAKVAGKCEDEGGSLDGGAFAGVCHTPQTDDDGIGPSATRSSFAVPWTGDFQLPRPSLTVSELRPAFFERLSTPCHPYPRRYCAVSHVLLHRGPLGQQRRNAFRCKSDFSTRRELSRRPFAAQFRLYTRPGYRARLYDTSQHLRATRQGPQLKRQSPAWTATKCPPTSSHSPARPAARAHRTASPNKDITMGPS